MSSFEFPQFKADSGFYRTLRERTSRYFVTNKLNSKSVIPGLLRMIPVFALAALAFGVMNSQIWSDSSCAMRCTAAVLFGICQALPLLHIMHDASHTSIGGSETWWKAVGRICVSACAVHFLEGGHLSPAGH